MLQQDAWIPEVDTQELNTVGTPNVLKIDFSVRKSTENAYMDELIPHEYPKKRPPESP
jgi:hypothetical protein